MQLSPLAKIAIDRGFVAASDAHTLHGLDSQNVIEAILRYPGTSERQFLMVISEHLALPFVDLSTIEIIDTLMSLISPTILFRHQAIPVGLKGDRVTVAVSNPCVESLGQEVEQATGLDVELVLAETNQIRTLLKDRLGIAGGTLEGMLDDDTRPADSMREGDDDESLANESSIVRLVNELLGDAIASGASDIHLEPSQRGFGVRYRVDGLMLDQIVSREMDRFHAAIVSRLKIMAMLNIAEKRLPQDGRIRFQASREEVDVRVSTIPMIHGESVVLRLLRKGRNQWGLAQLELPLSTARQWQQIINRTNGIILITGPTGSGKTTTLYHLLAEIRATRPDAKIITIEDPVEYSLPGIHQIQINEATGLTFARGLRSVLRHDPDVILLGEIRDQTTARHAIEAALTGHLVLASLHTNDAAGAFTRLMEMEIEPYLVASTLVAAAAQRLVRRLCPLCKKSTQVMPGEENAVLHQGAKIYEPGGCRECQGKGFKGRIPMLELLLSDAAIRKLCLARTSSQEIAECATKAGMLTLLESGFERVREGITCLAEVIRVAGDAPNPLSDYQGAKIQQGEESLNSSSATTSQFVE